MDEDLEEFPPKLEPRLREKIDDMGIPFCYTKEFNYRAIAFDWSCADN